MRQNMEKRYSEILTNISNFLNTNTFIQDNLYEKEKEYYLYIEQDAEKLLEINNYAILNLEIYKRIRSIFLILINFQEKENCYLKHIINDLYIIFKYVYESILFTIENEILNQSKES